MENAYDRLQIHIYCMYLFIIVDFFYKNEYEKKKKESGQFREIDVFKG